MRLSEIEKVTVPPSPPLSVRAMVNLHVQAVSQPGVVPHLLDGVQHRGRTACPRRPILPVKHKAAELIEIEVAVVSVFRYRDGRQV